MKFEMPIEKAYTYSGSSSTPANSPSLISESELCNYDRNKQLEVMSEWFLSCHEDPAERTPYESREGGYIWIWGGPYDPREELDKEFGSTVPKDVIDELVEQLGGDYAEGEVYPENIMRVMLIVTSIQQFLLIPNLITHL